jgi:hypothetical protein
MEEKLINFSATLYGDLQPYNEVSSLARCRIFYKGANRNGTYITDEFAEKLLSSIPYVPVKGIYDFVEEDYTDHGKQRYEGRIYGIVPENPNLSWEQHEDSDGIIRTYACVDVLLFTAIYKEAKEILGKSQSMELYVKSIEGDFQYIGGKRYFVYTNGCFLGLQALGEETEPCFEGAAFYNLQESFDKFFKQIDIYNSKSQKEDGGKIMSIVKFKLSDSQKYEMIWNLLNPNFNETGGYEISYVICDVFDEYAVVRNLEEGQFERVFYTKNDSNDSLTLNSTEVCYIVDVNQREKEVLDAMAAAHGSFEKAQENYEKIESENSEFSTKIEEQNTTISTLQEEKENISNELNEANSKYEVLSAENGELKTANEELSNYKKSIEKTEKESIINQYSGKIDEEKLESFTENIDNYSNEELEKELAYAFVQSNTGIFSYEGFIPREDSNEGGIEEILSKY